MAKQTIVVTGDKALNRKLRALSSTEAKKVARKSGRAALRPLLSAMKAGAPRRSGRLARSLKIKAMKRSRKMFGQRITTGAGTGPFGGTTFYGSFVELGTKHIDERKFMRNAVARTRAQSINIYRQEIARGIVAAAKRS